MSAGHNGHNGQNPGPNTVLAIVAILSTQSSAHATGRQLRNQAGSPPPNRRTQTSPPVRANRRPEWPEPGAGHSCGRCGHSDQHTSRVSDGTAAGTHGSAPSRNRDANPSRHTNQPQILLLRASQPVGRSPPYATTVSGQESRTSDQEGIKDMRIRLHGTLDELGPVLAELGKVLQVHDASRPYPDRPPSTLHRIYITATTRSNGERK